MLDSHVHRRRFVIDGQVKSRIPRILFVLPRLPKQTVAVDGIRQGIEGLSGTIASCLLVADGLAARGHTVGVWVRNGESLTGTSLQCFFDRTSALDWLGSGRLVLCTWQSDELQELAARGDVPWVWSQLPVSESELQCLTQRSVDGLIVVSDTVRLPLLHSAASQRIARVYNPLNPFFTQPVDGGPDRYRSRRVIFAGYIGKSKGVHRLLQMWSYVRERVPDACLTLAGSHKLYGNEREVGPHGIAEPDFEAKYIAPIVRRFGSLDAAGIQPVGLQSTQGLRNLFTTSALGVVNPNWHSYTETFCCAAVEMLGCGLPVFSCAAGALPEVIGRSGGAVLVPNSDLQRAGQQLAMLMDDTALLESLGTKGREYVTSRYDLAGIVDQWQELLATPAEVLYRVGSPWCGPRGLRYWVERGTRTIGAGRMLRGGIDLFKHALAKPTLSKAGT